MSKLDKDTVIANFTKAYEAANGKSPSIEAKGGWYSVDGGKNIRLAQLDEMINELGDATKKASAENTELKKEVAPAKAEKKKAVVKKTSAKKPKQPASSFSVKDFYTQQIQEMNPGSRAPR